MGIADGTHTLGPASGQLLIRTSRAGFGARAGHDLTIEVTRWKAEVAVDTEDVARSSVIVEADVGSFEVRTGTGGIKPLTDADRASISKTIREEILHTAQHPAITFRSSRVAGTPESFSIDGELTVIGRTQPISVHGEATADGVRGSAAVVQSRWGIRPYTAFFGALKLADEVTVEFTISVP
jgi:polyisoprenoid-binding protein YceI